MHLEQGPARRVQQDAFAHWDRAVARSIGVMRGNLGLEYSLRNLASSAWLSPFHFHRVFHRVTGSTPAKFLAAWRMAESKRLLAYSSDTVTDICMRIGYYSLGTFSSTFTRMVGFSPDRFRRLVASCTNQPFNEILAHLADQQAAPMQPQLTVSVGGGRWAG